MQRLNKELTVLAVIIVVTALAIAQAHRYGKTINEKGKALACYVVLPLPLPYSVFFAEGNCTR